MSDFTGRSAAISSQVLSTLFDRAVSEDPNIVLESEFISDLANTQETYQNHTGLNNTIDNRENPRKNRLSLNKKRTDSEAIRSSQLVNTALTPSGSVQIGVHSITRDEDVILISSESEDEPVADLPSGQRFDFISVTPPPTPRQAARARPDIEQRAEPEPEPEPEADPELEPEAEPEPDPEAEPEALPERPTNSLQPSSGLRGWERKRRAHNLQFRTVLLDGMITESFMLLDRPPTDRGRRRRQALARNREQVKILLQASRTVLHNLSSDAKVIVK
ncbi:uncharacterized protein LOC111609780 [Xiphophorus maculatus]|uniref:uncharacterized protein LOC111606297 n=1 Tax=Xiphophorus maculatus TaxID=8083 RepID=UPI000C6D2CFF|nr:uncharacterized protein LOC111606297 [Xiphophorus maculatus]XP_023184716.1 uncharacterized protein LOC111607089 [Xiphophorus maculatus]XP_023195933.1 uncharacterized protein LOC111609780 [Xiphophorus maculatus]